MSILLQMDEVGINFGGLTAVDHLTMSIEKGTIRALIGPNGAGKSTVFNIVTGIYKPTTGKIRLLEREIQGLQPHTITAAGIARTFQNIRLFSNLTVLDNVKIGSHCRTGADFLGAVLRWPGVRAEEKVINEAAMQALELVELAGKYQEVAKNLSYGEQRRLEIARALATNPILICLDEPAAGMNPREKQSLMNMIRRIENMGITIFLVEHDMKFVMNLAHRVTVLDYGRKIASGTPAEVQQDPAVIEAYMGREVDE